MITPELPVSVKRFADLFEIGFVFLIVPAILTTMDRPPFHLGGKILLWMGIWFLVRRLSESDRNRVLDGLSPLRRPWFALLALVSLAGTGAFFAVVSGLERFQALEPGVRWIAGAFMLPVFAVLLSLPVTVLTWGYIPVRFGDSTWLPRWLVASLPVCGLAMLHAVGLGWKAPLAALLLGGCAWFVFGKKVPMLPAVLVHALVGWIGVVGGVW